jgi:tRNA (cytidine/uridine-2'-O-)-methyltransferase
MTRGSPQEDGLVAVTRWYGGKPLGPARFRAISQVAKDLVARLPPAERTGPTRRRKHTLAAVVAAAAPAAEQQLHVVLVHPVIPSNTGAVRAPAAACHAPLSMAGGILIITQCTRWWCAWGGRQVGRSCLGFGATLHLVEPLGFSLDHKRVKRAGLDYWAHVDLRRHRSWQGLRDCLSGELGMGPGQLFFITKFGTTSMLHADFAGAAAAAAAGAEGSGAAGPIALIFGSEQLGLSGISDDPDLQEALRSPSGATRVVGEGEDEGEGATVDQPRAHTISLPMNDDRIRSYNLSGTVSMVLWEAYRQRCCLRSTQH